MVRKDDNLRTTGEERFFIDTTRMKAPSFKMVLTAHGDFVYPYKDTGVLVCPIGCLKGSEVTN